MTRVLLVSDFYPPFTGGAERQVHLLGQHLAARGHEVAVATVWHAGQARRERDGAVPVHRLKALATSVPWFSTTPGRRFHPPFPDPLIAWQLRRLVRRFRPDLVHAHGWIAYSCVAALLGLDVPLVISARDYGYSCALRTLLYRGRACEGPALAKCIACASRTYGRPKALVAVSAILAQRPVLTRRTAAMHSISSFVQSVVRRDVLRVPDGSSQTGAPILQALIPSFLADDPDTSSSPLAAVTSSLVTSSLDLLPSEPFVLFVGALQAHKGLDVLLAAYRQVRRAPPLVLIGTVWPDTPNELPEGVTVLHDVPHRDVMTAWKRCLFGVAPSIWPEPLGAVIFEAMSAGKAIIGTVPGGHADMIVDGETGLLVPAGDVDALANAIQTLVDHPDRRQALGRAARGHVAAFRAERVIPRFEALYSEVAARAHRTPPARGGQPCAV